MSNDTTAVLLARLLDLEERKDSIEFGPANGRIKVFVNSNDAAAAVENIQTMIDLRAYAEVAISQPIQRREKEANQ